MFTLFFLVCSTVSDKCYSATAEMIYPTEEACKEAAKSIMDRNYALQREDKMPPEVAIYKCYDWGVAS